MGTTAGGRARERTARSPSAPPATAAATWCAAGKLTQLTRDDSWVSAAWAEGILSSDEIDRHPLRNVITKAVGAKDDIELETVRAQARGRRRRAALLGRPARDDHRRGDPGPAHARSRPALEEAADALIDAANEAGGKDNVSVVLLALHGVAAARRPGGDGELRPLRDPRQARRRRDGRRLPRPRRGHRPRRGPEDAVRGAGRARRSCTSASSARRRPSAASTTRTSSPSTTSATPRASSTWPWSCWRATTCARSSSAGRRSRWPTACASSPQICDGPGLRALAGRRAPRRQAGQHPRDRARAGEDARLRPGPGGRARDHHAARRDPRHAGLHGPRAGDGQGRGPAQRHLLGGRRLLRVPDRARSRSRARRCTPCCTRSSRRSPTRCSP